MPDTPYLPIFHATRGGIVESIHFGAAAVVNADGDLVASYGDPEAVCFMRSAAKPFQALPFIERNGDIQYGFTSAEIALICASHSGTDQHVAMVKALQQKIGLDESMLLCGTHEPYHHPTMRDLILRGEKPTPTRHNCSGKHTGMLAFAKMMGFALEDYLSLDHPIQITIKEVFAEMCDLPQERVSVGIDGCSAPNFAVPLRNAALAYARLCQPVGFSTERQSACGRITEAMTAHGFVISGPGRFDMRVMDLTAGRILAKTGAEGYQSMGVLPGALAPNSPALGIAIKIADGDLTSRASPTVAVEVLRQLGAISPQEAASMTEFIQRPITNQRGIHVGDYLPTVTLRFQ